MGTPVTQGALSDAQCIPKKDGSEHVSCIEYESAWAFGANCGIDNLDQIAEMSGRATIWG